MKNYSGSLSTDRIDTFLPRFIRLLQWWLYRIISTAVIILTQGKRTIASVNLGPYPPYRKSHDLAKIYWSILTRGPPEPNRPAEGWTWASAHDSSWCVRVVKIMTVLWFWWRHRHSGWCYLDHKKLNASALRIQIKRSWFVICIHS
jgi:hypothetical protein